MSIAAIYARKSNDQNLPDEEKSVTRQVERAPTPTPRGRVGWCRPSTSTPTTGSAAPSL
jgi:hypothetical protein